jgi:methionyl-tRNA formyltransferase
LKLGILTSGSLGRDTLEKIIPYYDVSFVLTDTNSISIIDFCKNHNIPFFKGNPRNGKAYQFIKNIQVDVLISINFLFLIKSDIINHPKILSFNIHGSLLPKYRGRTPHVWAIINNEKNSGISAHIIDEGCDTGEILSQVIIPISQNDTGNDIMNQYKSKYFSLTKDVLGKIESNKLAPLIQDESLATYYGIRKPEDGRINWNWHKERIRNWVRAQANPYPGAFSFVNGNKLTIDEVEEVSNGFNSLTENGIVLEIEPNIIVKTPNGALKLTKFREDIKITKGDQLI